MNINYQYFLSIIMHFVFYFLLENMINQGHEKCTKQIPLKVRQFTRLNGYTRRQGTKKSPTQRPIQSEQKPNINGNKIVSLERKPILSKVRTSITDNLNVLKYLQFDTTIQSRNLQKKIQKSTSPLKRKTTKVKTSQSFPTEQDDRIIKESLIQIKKIHDIIKQLKSFGFSYKKVTQWMLKFLSKKKKLMKKIFINQHMNKKSVNDSYLYQHETNFEAMKNNLLEMVKRFSMRGNQQSYVHEILFLGSQLKEFRFYLEDILLHKNTVKLNELKYSIKKKYEEIKPSQWENAKICLEPPFAQSTQIAHFITDLNRLEDRYGEFSLISKLNRVKFSQLSQAEQFVKSKYKALASQL